MEEIPIISVSGGKDSTALYLLAKEYFGNNFVPVFADTGHEHPVTVNYVKNLHTMAKGPEVNIVKADFSSRIIKRRGNLLEKHFQGDTQSLFRINRLVPTGNPFSDLLLWKGRAPSSKAQFCTEHLKLWPIYFWLHENYPVDQHKWLMFTGIRGQESKKRSYISGTKEGQSAKQPFMWNGFFNCYSILALLYEVEETIFSILENAGVPPNPLYALGNSHVGCYPCIHVNKNDLSNLPDWAWDRLEGYEKLIGRTWFPPGIVPWKEKGELVTIADVREWCKMSRAVGGKRQYDIFKSNAPQDTPSCVSGWMECE